MCYILLLSHLFKMNECFSWLMPLSVYERSWSGYSVWIHVGLVKCVDTRAFTRPTAFIHQ